MAARKQTMPGRIGAGVPRASRPARAAVLVLALLVGACSPALPSPSPSSSPAAPSAAPSAAASATPAATPSAAPSATPAAASPAPSEAPWETLALPSPAPVGATLAAVAGSAFAADPAAGFRLQATSEVPLADLLARLRVDPPLRHDVAIAADGRSAVLVPASPLEARSTYRFTLLDPAGAPLTGWAFQVAGPPIVVGTIPADERTDVPAKAAIEVTFDQDGVAVEPGDIVVRLEPDATRVAGRIETHGRAAVFVPDHDLAPGRIYRVTVRAGTGAAGGAGGLARDVTFAFQVARLAATTAVRAELSKGFYTGLPGEWPLLAASQWRRGADGEQEDNSTPVAVRVYRLAGETAALRTLDRLLAAPAWAEGAARPAVSTEGLAVAFSGKARIVNVAWEPHLRVPVALGAGWYLVETRQGTPSQAVLQVTDIVGMAAVRADRLVAWVNDARVGGPVQAAPVSVVDGARLGRTDERGVLLVPTPASLLAASGPVFLRMSGPEGRRVIVELAGPEGIAARIRWEGQWAARWRPGLAAWWTALSTDRTTYRPTDTVQAWGFLRTRDGDRPPASVRLRAWRDTDGPRVGRPVATADATVASTGAWVGSLALRDLPYGPYLVEVVADGQPVEAISFEIGDLRKPPFELDVAVAPRAIVVGQAMTAAVEARFFEGTPAAGIPVAVTANAWKEQPDVRSETDTSGAATVSLRPDPFGEDSPQQYECPSVTVRPDAAVEAYVEGSEEVCIFRGSLYVDAEAVRDGDVLDVSGAVHEVDLAAVEAWLRRPYGERGELDPRGRPAGSERVEVQVTETTMRSKVSDRWYDPITKQVVEWREWQEGSSTSVSRAVTTRADGTFRLRLALPAGNLRLDVRVVAVDEAGHRVAEELEAWAVKERQAASWYHVGIRGATREFAPGETVTAEITHQRLSGNASEEIPVPTGGANRFLFLVTGRTRVDALVGSRPRATVRFTKNDEPNLYFEAVWFTGRAYVLPGSATARLREEDRRISVALAADRTRYAPGDTATVTIRTTDAAGRPVPASVLLRGIDAKLFEMGDAAFADPLGLIYRALDVGFLAGPIVSHEARFAIPGGGGSTTGDDRVDFRDALPTRMVTTGADGLASVDLRLPDDVTSWRVGAAAITADRRAGSGTASLPVGLPFFVDATIAPDYLVGDRPAIRLRAFGSALANGTAVSFTVESASLAMAPVTVAGTAFAEVLVPLPPLTAGTHRVTISARSAAGSDRLVRTFVALESRLAAGHRVTVPIEASTAIPGGPGLTRLVVADAGRARYLELLVALAAPRGERADERLAATIARSILVERLGIPAADLPAATPFARSPYQVPDGGLALLPDAAPDLELTVRALVADPAALAADPARAWLRAIADGAARTVERRAVALAGLAALGAPVLGELRSVLDDPTAGGRTRLWAALGLALLGEREIAVAVERELLARWGERRGDQVRLRISADAEEVSEATELLALLAAHLDDPLAAEALAYVTAVPPRDDLAVLTQVTVAGRLVERLPVAEAAVAVVESGERTTLRIPAGGTVTLEVTADRRAGMRLERVSGSAAVTATWDEPAPAAADLGSPDPDLALARTVTPGSPIAATSLVHVALDLQITGPGRDGEVEVVDVVPSGLAALQGGSRDCGAYSVTPARIDGQRVVFVVRFHSSETGEQGDSQAVVPGTFCLDYLARVVTAGTYAWQPAVARQSISPGFVAVTPPGTVELR